MKILKGARIYIRLCVLWVVVHFIPGEYVPDKIVSELDMLIEELEDVIK